MLLTLSQMAFLCLARKKKKQFYIHVIILERDNQQRQLGLCCFSPNYSFDFHRSRLMPAFPPLLFTLRDIFNK